MTATLVPADPTAAVEAGVAADPGAAATLVSEVSSKPRHDLPVLEAYRGLAALMVVFTRVGFIAGSGVVGPWAGWLSRLDFGVALFFLLSGFLLFRPFVQAGYGRRPAVATRSYLRRRFVRIYPAFLLVVAFDWVITPKSRQADGSLWFQTVFMLQNYTNNFVSQLPGLVQSWSLAVEVSFYLCLPVLAWVALGRGTRAAAASARMAAFRAEAAALSPEQTRRAKMARRRRPLLRRIVDVRLRAGYLADVRPGIVIGLYFAFAVGWRLYQLIHLHGLDSGLLWLPAFMDWFGAGMALAWLRERTAGPPQLLRYIASAPGACWALALAGYWLTTTSLAGPFGLEGPSIAEAMFKHLVFVVIAVLMLLPAVFGDRSAGWRRTATNPFFTWLGQVSFGIFLWHPMLLDAIRAMIGREPFDGGFWISLILTLAASAIAATLSWKYLEEPLQRRWRNGFRARRPARRDRSATAPV